VTESKNPQSNRCIALAVALKPLVVRTRLMRAVREARSWEIVRPMMARSELDAAIDLSQVCDANDITPVSFLSEEYPVALGEIPDPPAVLFQRSCSSSTVKDALCVGVVGTRAASVEMCHRASELGAELVAGGVSVVSGLALGIDGAAHRGAIQGDLACPTIAVLAHGLDHIYPPSHRSLAEAIIASGGALISEYPPGVKPFKHQFLARNRIIAGLSRGVIVVEAGARSGSLVTARFAADFGRDVFVMDVATSDERVAGGVSLIEQGASQITSARDVLIEYGLTQNDRSTEGAVPDDTLELSLDALMDQTGVSTSDVLRLELAGLVRLLPGNRCSIRARILADLRETG